MAPSAPPPLGLLNEAINTISANQLRALVRELCTCQKTLSLVIHEWEECIVCPFFLCPSKRMIVLVDIHKHFSDRLLVDLTTEDADNTSAEEGASTGQKRKHTRQRYEVCEQCNDEYDVEINDDTSCVWHDGETEPDHDGDFWADHDEDCHGTIDSEWARKEFPEGFIWNCCDEIGADAEGCQIGAHVPKSRKKARSLTKLITRP
ncbi:hypothetical protein RB595_003926 [Gaeumannomyces hyphopodioides]